LTKTVQKAE